MDKSKIFQPNQEYELGKGLLNVNIYNGRMLYSYPIASIGSGNFQIDASLVYNASYKANDFGDKKIGFGNGWKYNFEEFIFQYNQNYNLEGFDPLDYVYIDSNWCIHRFVKYKECKGYDNPRSVYYDESGTGLKLIVIKDSNYKIIDECGSTYYFDCKSGKLTTIISGVNSLIIKNIEYDESKEKVLSIYDSRKEYQRLKFNYNQNNFPIKAYATNSNVYHTFEYNGTELVSIYKENGKSKKQVHEFRYNESLISYIINSENLKAMNLEYTAENDNYVLQKIILGAMKEMIIAEKMCSEVYCGDDVCLGEENYVADSTEKYIKSNLIMPNKYISSTITYDYNNSYTEVTDFKGIKIRYYFDVDGRNISSLEYNDKVLSEIHNYTSVKPTGWEIGSDGDSNIFINDKKAEIIYKSNNKYTLAIKNNNLTAFKNIFSDETEKTSEHFTLSFWLMFNNLNDSTLLAKLKYTLNNQPNETQVIIKNTLGGSWQCVSIPLNLGFTQTTLQDLSLELDVDTKLNITNDKIIVADIRINKGNSQITCIDNLKINDKTYMELKIGSKLYYCDDYEREVTLSPDFYLTEADIIATYRSLYYSIKNNDTYYELFYCNKTKIKAVTYISMLPFFLTNDLSVRENHKYYRFDFAEYSDDGKKEIVDTPNYHFRSIDLVAIGEDKKNYRVVEFQRKIKTRGNNRYYFETSTLMGIVEDNEKVLRLDETNSVCIVVEENDDGTERRKKYIKRIYDDNNELEKEVNIITENEYDSFGNISKVVIKADDSSVEQLTEEYIYCENNPEKNEYIEKIITNGNIVTAKYNNNGLMNSSILEYNKKYTDGKVTSISQTNINKIEYLYDDFENLVSLRFYDKKGTLIGENRCTYNKQGNLCNLNDKSGVQHGFVYNALSELSEVYRNKKLLKKELTELSDTFDINKIYLYHGNILHLTTNIYDEYGKIISTSIDSTEDGKVLNTKKILFEYEDNGLKFSKGLEKIKKIIDPFANKTYAYEYEESITDGTTYKIRESDNYSVTIKPNGAKIYDIMNDSKQIKNVLENEDQMNNNPKYSYNYTKAKNSDEWEENIYNSYDYEYDNLGRMICKKGKPDVYTNATITINKNINYYENSNFPKKFRYNINSKLKGSENSDVNADIVYENSYEKDNITKVKETGSRFIQNPKNSSSQGTTALETITIYYEYDDNNRLIKETKSNGDTLIYTYGLESGMIEKVAKNNVNNIIKTLEYNAGMLTKVDDDDIIYDNYGNITKFGKNNITYNSRNLLESYTNGSDKLLFEYNYQGIRTKKINNNSYEVNYYLDGSKIIGEDVIDKNSNTIIRKFRYFYDVSGVCGINYIIDDVDHYFNLIKDSLGNVAKVMYRGKIIGEYIYDAWGNCVSKVFADTNPNEIDKYIVNNNPFRFKGYYCDLEANLYYCQTRYYYPQIYQWLSPDNINYLTTESINGFNLYCYCGNNPVNRYDPTGHFAWLIFAFAVLLFTPVGGVITQAAVSTVSYVGMSVCAVGDKLFNGGKGAWADMCRIKWNPFNADEEKVMESKNISFYKGVPVFQISDMGGSMSLGAIFFDKSQGVEVLKHERGHNTQLMLMGLGNYIIQIGIPSIWKNDDDTPWELSASMLGGSNIADEYSEKQRKEAKNYLIRAMIPFVNIYNIFQYILY